MKKKFKPFIFFMFLLPSLLIARETAGPVSIDLEKSGHEWVRERDESFSLQGITEFSLAGEDPDGWTEVVTVQYFNGVKVPPKELFSMFIEDLKRESNMETIDSETIIDEPEDFFAEWAITGGPTQDQYEWLRIMTKGDTTAIVRFSTRKMDKVDESRVVWEEILKDVEFK